MKKIILLLATLSIFLIAGEISTGVENGEKYRVFKSHKGGYYIKDSSKYNKVNKSTSLSQDKAALKRQLRIIAKTLKKSGYKYFVLTNRDMNNVNGFPINRANDLHRYLTLKKKNPAYYTSGRLPKNSARPGNGYRFKYQPMNSKATNSYMTLWSVSQTLKDTK